MPGTGLTESVLENIESGRKSSITVAQVLNLARTLQVPVVSLLAPMARPEDPLDLPDLGSAFTGMSAAEFDSWLCSVPNAGYVAESSEERSDRAELQALRELTTLTRELRRLEISASLESELQPDALRSDSEAQRLSIHERINGLRNFLTTAG